MFKRISTIIALIILLSLQNAVYAQAQQSGASAPAASGASASASSGSAQPAIQPSVQSTALPQMTPQQAGAYQSLSPAQQQAIQAELGKSGGQITPQTVEALKGRAEFKDISPAEIEKGRELLEQKEKAQDKTADEGKDKIEKKNLPWEEKTVIGEQALEGGLFERSRRFGKYQDVSLDLQLFGSDFFRDSAVRVVTDRKDIPVPLKYVVGPGDEVKLMLWGRLNAQHNLTIDREGKITIPNVGPLFVAGMTFEDMSKYLITQAEQIVGTNIDISMGSLKSISIFVLGDVRRPGAYTIGSFATITDALVMVGGASNIGSMRRIQLRRNNKLITTFDLYDLLLKGDKSKDAVLQSGDVIFVPVTGPLVGIAGNVKRPAIYELKDKHDLHTVIENAGGIIPTAYTQQIQVERIIKGEKQIVVDLNDKKLEHASHFQIQDADLVKIFSIVDANVNAVYINGNVKRPGKYEYKPGMTIRDILSKPEELLPETHYDYALIKRLKPPSMEASLIPFNLGKFIFNHDSAHNIALMPQDQIFIFSKWFFQDKPHFSIGGEVRKGGRFEMTDNFRVKDAILVAGYLTRDAYMDKAEILRKYTGEKRGKYQTIYFSVAGALAEKDKDNILLQDEDRIIIHSVKEHVYDRTVAIEGEILKPGTFQFTSNMRVKDLIFASGNVLESTYLDDAEITSMQIDNNRSVKYVQTNINLRNALAGDENHNVRLQPYDRIFVKKITNWRDENFVTVGGELKFNGRYMITKGEKLSSIIQRAGGYTDDAYLRAAVFTRQKVKEMQQKSIEEMAARLEKELLASSAIQASTALSAEEIAGKKVEIEQKRMLIETMKNVKAQGRMSIKLGHLRLLQGSEYDFELEDGDALFIPPKNSVVGVVGAVMSSGAYIFSQKADYRDYIQMSGGYSKYADTGNVYILKVDGTARQAYKGTINWNDQKDRLELAAFSENNANYIEPGDVIAVPENFERIAWLREIRDITQILMNTAVAAGVVIKLF